MSGYVQKSVETRATCTIDWSEGYLQADEYVAGDLGWSVVPSLGQGDAAVAMQSIDPRHSKAELIDGVPGKVYMVTARARTNRGREIERAIVLRVVN